MNKVAMVTGPLTTSLFLQQSVFTLIFPYCNRHLHFCFLYFILFDLYFVHGTGIRSRTHPSIFCVCYHCAIWTEGCLMNLYIYIFFSSSPVYNWEETHEFESNLLHCLYPISTTTTGPRPCATPTLPFIHPPTHTSHHIFWLIYTGL